MTQDFEITVTSANDAPVIENTGLTQVIVDENTGFVIDIDVTDQDSATHRFDLLYHRQTTRSGILHTRVMIHQLIILTPLESGQILII